MKEEDDASEDKSDKRSTSLKVRMMTCCPWILMLHVPPSPVQEPHASKLAGISCRIPMSAGRRSWDRGKGAWQARSSRLLKGMRMLFSEASTEPIVSSRCVLVGLVGGPARYSDFFPRVIQHNCYLTEPPLTCPLQIARGGADGILREACPEGMRRSYPQRLYFNGRFQIIQMVSPDVQAYLYSIAGFDLLMMLYGT